VVNITLKTPDSAKKNIRYWMGPRAGLDDVEKRKANKIKLYLQGVNWNK